MSRCALWVGKVLRFGLPLWWGGSCVRRKRRGRGGMVRRIFGGVKAAWEEPVVILLDPVIGSILFVCMCMGGVGWLGNGVESREVLEM